MGSLLQRALQIRARDGTRADQKTVCQRGALAADGGRRGCEDSGVAVGAASGDGGGSGGGSSGSGGGGGGDADGRGGDGVGVGGGDQLARARNAPRPRLASPARRRRAHVSHTAHPAGAAGVRRFYISVSQHHVMPMVLCSQRDVEPEPSRTLCYPPTASATTDNTGRTG